MSLPNSLHPLSQKERTILYFVGCAVFVAIAIVMISDRDAQGWLGEQMLSHYYRETPDNVTTGGPPTYYGSFAIWKWVD